MATQFKRYKSIFGESKEMSKQTLSKKEAIIRSIKRSLREEEGMAQKDIESVVGKIEEVITDVIGQHGVDNSVVDALANTVKDINSQNTIINDIDMFERQLSKRYSSVFAEAEEDEPFGGKQAPPFDAEDAEEAREKKAKKEFKRFHKNFLREEDEESETEEDEEKEEKKENRIKRQRSIQEMRAKLSRKRSMSEGDDEESDDDDKMAAVRDAKKEALKKKSRFIREEDEMETEDELEEEIYGFKPKFREESETDEGDLIDDESGSDYDAMSLDSEGNYSSDRGMEADEDDNASEDM